MPDSKETKKWVYLFYEGHAKMRDLLGGKGAGVAEMTNAGLPVPPGFTITTEACNAFYEGDKHFPQGMWEQVLAALKIVEQQIGKGFGRKENPLLVSVRSGAKFSMPGIMDTVFNLGINDETVLGLVALTGDERFAYDAYRRLIQMFSKIVLGAKPEEFEQVIDQYKERAGVTSDAEIPAGDLKRMVVEFKQIAERQLGEPFPNDGFSQLCKAIEAVFSSWDNELAIDYRNFNKIPHNLGTAVNVQSMVFGNMGNDSGTGVAFTRNPSTGEKELYGEYLLNAQGEDVAAGIRVPSKISNLQQDLPHVYQQFKEIAQLLERHFRDVQDLEFTIEHGRLWLLQTRSAYLSAEANLRSAIDLLDEGLISEREAVFRVSPWDLHQILAPKLPSDLSLEPIARGQSASPGAAHGEAVFDSDRARKLSGGGQKIILVLPELRAEDVDGFYQAQGVITNRGSVTSHAARLSRILDKPCVAGAAIDIDRPQKLFIAAGRAVREGDKLTINGSTGAIYEGMIPVVEVDPREEPYLRRYIALLASISADDYVENGAGFLWMLKDTIRDRAMPSIVHSIPVQLQISRGKKTPKKYISFTHPSGSVVSKILREMQGSNDPDISAVIWGIVSHLGRMLQNEVGIGNHHLAIRPMIDPQRAFVDLQRGSVTSGDTAYPVQLIGQEFFAINHFLPNYLPWGSVQWWVTVQLPATGPKLFWCLDRSNPRGESMIPGANSLVGFLIVLNGRCL